MTVPLDYHEALNWFTKAADQGEPHAACRIGDIYFQGQGVDVEDLASVTMFKGVGRDRSGREAGDSADGREVAVICAGAAATAAVGGFDGHTIAEAVARSG